MPTALSSPRRQPHHVDPAAATARSKRSLAAQIIDTGAAWSSAQRDLVQLAARFDTSDEWIRAGSPTAAHWIADALDICVSTAREWVRVGKALAGLTAIDTAFAAKELSYSKVRALTRVATSETESELCDIARRVSAGRLGHALAAWTARHETDEAREARHQRDRHHRWRVESDGMVAGSWRLPPADAGRLIAALDAHLMFTNRPRSAAAARHHRSTERGSDASADASSAASLAQQRADALVSLTRGGAEVATEVVIHVRGDGCTLDDGTPIPGSVVERLAPDAFLRTLSYDAARQPINASGRHRHRLGRHLIRQPAAALNRLPTHPAPPAANAANPSPTGKAVGMTSPVRLDDYLAGQTEISSLLGAVSEAAGAEQRVTAIQALLAHDCVTHSDVELTGLHADLASALSSVGRHDDAIEAWEGAIAAGYCSAPHPRANIAELLLISGRTEEGTALFEELRGTCPDDPWLRNSAGWAFAKIGDHSTALDWIEEGLGLAINSGDPERISGQLADMAARSRAALGLPPDPTLDQRIAAIEPAPRHAGSQHWSEADPPAEAPPGGCDRCGFEIGCDPPAGLDDAMQRRIATRVAGTVARQKGPSPATDRQPSTPTPTPTPRARARARPRARATARACEPIRSTKVGRNEPCPCGSGRKHKRCCGAP